MLFRVKERYNNQPVNRSPVILNRLVKKVSVKKYGLVMFNFLFLQMADTGKDPSPLEDLLSMLRKDDVSGIKLAVRSFTKFYIELFNHISTNPEDVFVFLNNAKIISLILYAIQKLLTTSSSGSVTLSILRCLEIVMRTHSTCKLEDVFVVAIGKYTFNHCFDAIAEYVDHYLSHGYQFCVAMKILYSVSSHTIDTRSKMMSITRKNLSALPPKLSEHNINSYRKIRQKGYACFLKNITDDAERKCFIELSGAVDISEDVVFQLPVSTAKKRTREPKDTEVLKKPRVRSVVSVKDKDRGITKTNKLGLREKLGLSGSQTNDVHIGKGRVRGINSSSGRRYRSSHSDCERTSNKETKIQKRIDMKIKSYPSHTSLHKNKHESSSRQMAKINEKNSMSYPNESLSSKNNPVIISEQITIVQQSEEVKQSRNYPSGSSCFKNHREVISKIIAKRTAKIQKPEEIKKEINSRNKTSININDNLQATLKQIINIQNLERGNNVMNDLNESSSLDNSQEICSEQIRKLEKTEVLSSKINRPPSETLFHDSDHKIPVTSEQNTKTQKSEDKNITSYLSATPTVGNNFLESYKEQTEKVHKPVEEKKSSRIETSSPDKYPENASKEYDDQTLIDSKIRRKLMKETMTKSSRWDVKSSKIKSRITPKKNDDSSLLNIRPDDKSSKIISKFTPKKNDNFHILNLLPVASSSRLLRKGCDYCLVDPRRCVCVGDRSAAAETKYGCTNSASSDPHNFPSEQPSKLFKIPTSVQNLSPLNSFKIPTSVQNPIPLNSFKIPTIVQNASPLNSFKIPTIVQNPIPLNSIPFDPTWGHSWKQFVRGDNLRYLTNY